MSEAPLEQAVGIDDVRADLELDGGPRDHLVT